MGLYTQQDPIGIAGGLNLYGYAGGDPINFSDPFGLNPDCDELGAPTGAACYGLAGALLFGAKLVQEARNLFEVVGEFVSRVRFGGEAQVGTQSQSMSTTVTNNTQAPFSTGTVSVVAPELSAKATLGMDLMRAPEGSETFMLEASIPKMGPFAGVQLGMAAGQGLRPTYLGIMGGVGFSANPAASSFDASWVAVDWTRLMAGRGR